MAFFKFVMITIEVVCAFLLVGIILLQRTKSQGLGGLAFGQSMGESIFGSRAGNVLTRGTVWLGAAFMINTVLLAALFAGRERSLMEKAEGARADAPAATAPQTPGPQPGGPAVPVPAAAPDAAAPTVPVTVPVSPVATPPPASPAAPAAPPVPASAAPAPATPPAPAPAK